MQIASAREPPGEHRREPRVQVGLARERGIQRLQLLGRLLQQARAALLRGQIAFASGGGSDAPALLVKAAKQLEPLDAALARQTYLDAWLAAMFAGRFAGAGDLHEVSRAARSAPPPADAPSLSDLLLDGLAVLVTEGRAEAAPLLRRAAQVFAE